MGRYGVRRFESVAFVQAPSCPSNQKSAYAPVEESLLSDLSNEVMKLESLLNRYSAL